MYNVRYTFIMKTWLRDDGVWVSDKPEVYVVGKDCDSNNILNTDNVVALHNGKLKFGYSGKQLREIFYTSKEIKFKEELLIKHGFLKIRDTDEEIIYQLLFDDSKDSFIEVNIDKESGQTTVELFCQNEDGTYDAIEL